MPFGDRHDRCAVGAVIGLCGLRRDGQDHDAQRRERGNGERRFHPYQADAASRARHGPVGAARQHYLVSG